ncbi:HET-domain-containing protein, partial [Ophiobolus disseminans]
MRLLNTQTLELKQFNTGSIPVYAILSHTWEDDEVTLQELQTRAARRKKGFRKISDFCDEAASRGIEWGWVDTCCIDKTDLVELSQAINSMFSWYRDAAVCLAYLSDFHLHGEGAHWNDKDVGKSRWFTRGWTLQELIAPKHLVFYDARWRVFGTKKGLASFMSDITGISARLLRGEKSLHEFSCAQKMSWAAYRQTTRVEDRAYSLLGLFNICFSPVYGEGWRAFGRLQEEILRVSTDQSIFAW